MSIARGHEGMEGGVVSGKLSGLRLYWGGRVRGGAGVLMICLEESHTCSVFPKKEATADL
jgi:hypothetical protein